MSDGVVFLLDNPYLPPITLIFFCASFNTATTSRYKGSPALPDSFVRSSTAIFLTDVGKTFKKYFEENKAN